jgi:predicted SAM-dependent methyltransferase
VREAFVEQQLAELDVTKRRCTNLHLGSGSYCPKDWVNVDMIGGDMRMNLGWSLPFEDQRFRLVFSAHAFEHLDYHSAGPRLLREVWRVLRPDGVLRLVVPNLAAYAEAYASRNNKFFRDFDKVRPEFGSPAGYITPMSKLLMMGGSAVRPGMWFEHKMGYDFETLCRMLTEAGFASVSRSHFSASEYPEFVEIDGQSNAAKITLNGVENSLFVEAKK